MWHHYYFPGHNTDGKYFVTSSKLGFAAETRPRRVMVFIDKSRDGQLTSLTDVEIADVACGQNHIVALDKKVSMTKIAIATAVCYQMAI